MLEASGTKAARRATPPTAGRVTFSISEPLVFAPLASLGRSAYPNSIMANSLKKTLLKQGMKLISDPRVVKVMQDERVMKAVVTAMSVPGKVQSFTAEQMQHLAKSMALATEDEVSDLKRTVRRLEEEIARLEKNEKR